MSIAFALHDHIKIKTSGDCGGDYANDINSNILRLACLDFIEAIYTMILKTSQQMFVELTETIFNIQQKGNIIFSVLHKYLA